MMCGVLLTGRYFHGIGTFAASSLILGTLLAGLVLYQREFVGSGELAVLLEVAVPVPVLIASAGLVQSDPALVTVAATRYPVSRLLLNRWIVLLLIGTIPAAALHVVGAWVTPEAPLPLLTSLSPLFFLSALALSAAALFATPRAGIGAAAAWWAASLFSAGPLRDACQAAGSDVCVLTYLSTTHTVIGMDAPGWSFNRLVLLGLAAALLLATTLLYTRIERHLHAPAAVGADE